MRAAKDQARQRSCAVSPEPLQITLKRKDVDEGLGKNFYRQVEERLVLIAYTSSNSLKKGFR